MFFILTEVDDMQQLYKYTKFFCWALALFSILATCYSVAINIP